MDESANKALVIGTAIFVTILITSGVFYTIAQMQNVYSAVYNTDTAIQNRFDEFDAYENTTKTGIEVVNALNKYLNNNLVEIRIQGLNIGSDIIVNKNEEIIKTLEESINTSNTSGEKLGEMLFKSTLTRNNNNDKKVIVFVKQ